MKIFKFFIIIIALSLSQNIACMSIDSRDTEITSKIRRAYSDWISYKTEEFVDLLPKYYAINSSEALSIIDSISKRIINDKISLNVDVFSFLAALKNIDSLRFESVANHILDNKFYSFVGDLFDNPEFITKFDNSKLSLDSLLNRVAVLISTKHFYEAGDVLDAIGTLGKKYHHKYCDKILPMINAMPNELLNIGIGFAYIDSTEKPIQDTSFNLLLSIICGIRGPILDVLSIIGVNKLFKLAQDNYSQDYNDSYYEKMYTAFKGCNSDHALMILWFKLFSVDSELLRKMINDYFKLDEQSFKDMDWNDLMNMIILKSIKQQSITLENIVALIQILLIDGDIPFNMSEELGVECIARNLFNTSARAGIYKQLFKAYMKDRMINKIHKLNEAVEQSSDPAFKRYVKYLNNSLQANNSYDLFAIQRSLIDLGELFPGLDILPIDKEPLFNAFNIIEAALEYKHNLKVIDTESDIMYGILAEKDSQGKSIFKLYAWDKKTGYATWRAPFTINTLVPLGIDEKYIYIPSEGTRVARISKYIGDKDPIVYFTIPEMQDIKNIIIIGGILYISSLEKILAIDTSSKEILYFNEMPSKEIKRFFSIREKLIVVGESSIMAYDETGLLFYVDSYNELPYESKIYEKDNILYFTSRVNKVVNLNSVDLITYKVERNINPEILIIR